MVKTTGDGLLAEFASVVDAVRCAVAFQEGMAERNADTPEERRIEFRIGVNLGDVIVQDDDVFGDGVNIAARLEGLAEPGGAVVSGSVHEQVKGKVEFRFDDLGPQEVKNIAEPVRAFKIRPQGDTAVTSDESLALPDKPSIAVLPFENMSGDQIKNISPTALPKTLSPRFRDTASSSSSRATRHSHTRAKQSTCKRSPSPWVSATFSKAASAAPATESA